MCEPNIILRYEMIDALSALKLRLYIVKQTYVFDEKEVELFEQSLNRLGILLDRWEKLERPKKSYVEGTQNGKTNRNNPQRRFHESD